MALTEDDFQAAANEITQRVTADKTRAVVDFAAVRQPDAHATNLKVSREVGIPPDVVPEFMGDINKRKLGEDFIGLIQTAPKTHQFVTSDPNHAALMQDALPQSVRMEAATKQPDWREFEAKQRAERESRGQAIGEIGRGILAGAATLVPQTAAGVTGLARMATEVFVSPFSKALASITGGKDYAAESVHRLAGEQNFQEAVRADMAQKAGTLMHTGGISEGVVSGLSSAAQLGLALAAPELALPFMAGTTTGQAYGAAREKGVAPIEAIPFAAAQGIIEYFTEKFALGKFLEAATKGRPLARAALGVAVKDIGGEQVATFFQDLNEVAVLTPEKPMSQFWEERPNAALQTLIGTLVGGGGAATLGATVDTLNNLAGRKVEEPVQLDQQRAAFNALQAEVNQSRLQELFTVANEHPLRARESETFKAWVTSVTEDSDLAEVYVDATKLNEVLTQQGTTLQELQAAMPEVATQLGEALATQGEVRIPLADLVTHITNPAVQEALLPHLKNSPDGMTYDQSQVFYQEQVSEMEAQAQKLAEGTPVTEEEVVLTREEFEAQAAPEQPVLAPEAQQRIGELQAKVDAGEALPEAESIELGLLQATQQAVAQQPTAPKQTYEQYLSEHKDKAAVRAAEVKNIRSEIVREMKGMKVFPEHVASAYSAPLVSFYLTNSARLGIMPSELRKMLPVRFAAEALMEGKRPRYATAEDFTKANIGSILSKQDWAIMTAKNPGAGVVLTAEENTARNEALKADLDAAGLKHIPATGVHERPDEKSFIVLGITEEQALELGRKHGQGSVLTRDGLLYADGMITESKGLTVHETAPKRYYTTLPDGAMFTVELEMDAAFNLIKKPRAAEPRDPAEVLLQEVDQTQTEAFKKWFGDSKVVDAEGKPRVLYHGTSVSGISVFKGWRGLAGHFAFDAEFASGWAEAKHIEEQHTIAQGGEDIGDGGQVYPVYLRALNIFDARNREHLSKVGLGKVVDYEDLEANQQKIREAGFDAYLDFENADEPSGIAVFEPTQIKSAIGNAGTFDPKNPNILYQGGKLGEVSVTGHHFSQVRRVTLDGRHYGTGAKGAEARRLAASTDRRISQRLHFYVDEGNGVFPEAGVGREDHVVKLSNLYDAARNPLRIPADDFNAFESAVLDAGFDGYYIEQGFTRQGVAVLLGEGSHGIDGGTPSAAQYAQAMQEVVMGEVPEKWSPQDLADVRKLWAIYASSEEAAKYPSFSEKAKSEKQLDLFANFKASIANVFSDAPNPPSVRDRSDAELLSGYRKEKVGEHFTFVVGHPSLPVDARVSVNLQRRDMWIDISQWKEGGGGSRIYKAVLDFARANKFTFIGDPNDISTAGIKRRLENLLSHAIQSGDTSYMALHPKQLSFIEQETGERLNWVEGNHKNNVEQMLKASYNLTILDIPELQNVYFDFIRREYIDASAKEAIADFEGYVAKTRRDPDEVRRKGAAGATTAARAVFTNTILRAHGTDSRRLVFDRLAAFVLESLPGAQRLLYQSVEAKPTFYSALTRVLERFPQAQGTPAEWQGRLVTPEERRTVAIRDKETNRPTGETKVVISAPRPTMPGVRMDELEFTGVLDWLEEQKTRPDSWQLLQDGVVIAQKPATDAPYVPAGGQATRLYAPSKELPREAIVDYLRDNLVVINPLTKSGEDSINISSSNWETEEPDPYYLLEDARERMSDEHAAADARQRIADDKGIEPEEVTEEQLEDWFYEREERWYWEDGDSPKYRVLTATFGDEEIQFDEYYSYGETYLRTSSGKEIDLIRGHDVEDAIRRYIYENYGTNVGGEAAKWPEYQLPGGADYTERLLINESHKGQAFEYTTHFDEENIAAFTRYNTRFIPLGNLEATHPELVARLRSEGKTQAKVYFLEELQSDWAQKGRERGNIQIRYAREELSVDEEQKKEAEERRAALKVVQSNTARPGEEPHYVYIILDEGGNTIGYQGGYVLKAEAEQAKNQIVGDFWYIKAPDNVFQIPKRNYPTLEAAMQYIIESKTRTEQGKLTAFEASKRAAELDAQYEEVMSDLAKLRGSLITREGVDRSNVDELLEMQPLLEKKNAIRAEQAALPREQVPYAPFVKSTDAWVALAMKDAIRNAAENDYDIVAWTTGSQQTERWSGGLRKKVDTIRWEKTPEGVHIIALQRGQEKANTKYQEDALTSAIGKTMAERIIADPNQSGEISGEGIVVADLGMSYTYGNAEGMNPEGKIAIYPKVANNVLEALRGGKVSKIDFVPQAGERVAVDEYVVSQPGFEITPKMKEMALQGQPLFQPKNLASFDPRTLTVSMMKGANLSSVLHESGHFYLEALSAMSAHPNAPQQMKDDFDKTLAWFGVPDRATWNNMTLDQKRPFHEQWAQSQERWYLEGKAPSLEMQPVFERFRKWMLSVYRSVEQFLRANPLAGKLNDEMRGVFSRLVAAEDTILEAERVRSYAALFPAAEAGNMTDEQFEAYRALGDAATQAAITDMQGRMLRDLKWLSNAKNKALKKLQKEASAKRKTIREEVTAEVAAEQINQARRFLTTGEALDPATGEFVKAEVGFKLNSDDLATMYPKTALSLPDLSKLRGMTNREGLHPDMVAPMFGFPSGDALVRELIAAEPMKDKIDGLTDQRMLERHGELVDADSLERAAEAAIHNEVRARFLATGLQILTKSPMPAKDMLKAAKQAAENTIARKKVRELRPKQYASAEARANKQALAEAARDPAKAAEAQRAALLNNQLSKAATEAQEEVEKFLRFAAKFESEGTRKNLDTDYLEQIDDLLAPFDLRKGETLKAIDKRRTLAAWVEWQEDMGFEPVLDAALMEEAKRKHYKDMTLEELRDLVDSIKQIEHLGRLKKKLLTAKDAREFAERIEEAVASLEANANREVTERGTPSDVVGIVGGWARTMAADHRKFASIVREMDGSKDNGVMWNLLVRSMNEAGDTETEMRAQAAEKLAVLFRGIREKTGGIKSHIKAKRTQVPGTKLSMTYEERIMFAMNWGNEGNRQRLLDGGLTGQRSIAEADAVAVLETLDKEDWGFVQGVWDYIGSYRDPIAEQERRLTGKEPEWVDPAPVQTKFGTYLGGYFPAKYDAELSSRSESLEAATTSRLGMKGAFNSAATRSGYAKKRAEEVKDRPLLLSFNAISQHANEVIHRLAWQDWLIDANRVLKALDGPIRDSYGVEILRAMRDTVKDIAAGDAPASGAVETAINRIRVGSTVVGMAWRISTALLQPTGLAQSWVRIGGPWIARGLKQYLKNPMAAAELVNSKSKLMRDRGRTMQREINEVLNTVRVGDTMAASHTSYFWLIQKMQRTVDIPTWLGAYEKAAKELKLEGAGDAKTRQAIEESCIALADQAVIDAQSGGQLKDLAKAQRGSPIFKLFTNFYSYFSATYNLNVEAYRRTSFRSPSEVGMLAVDLLILNTVPVVMAVALKELLKGGCEDDDIECLLGRIGHEQLNFLMGQMILLREAGAALDVATGGGGFGYSGPAGLRFFGDLYKLGQQAGQGEADLAFFKAANQVAGAVLHYPAGQINSTVEGIVEVEKGNVEGVSILPALIAGKPRKEG